MMVLEAFIFHVDSSVSPVLAATAEVPAAFVAILSVLVRILGPLRAYILA